MRSLTLITTILILASLLLLSACSKEETAPAPKSKPPAIQAAEQAAAIANISTGQKIYVRSCAFCHTTGTSNAPKLGDKDVWSKLMHEGPDHMVKNAIFGIGKMPPKGGDHSLSDAQVKLAVEYIIEQIQ